ncbi:uncharacterized protein LOC122274364 [Carya illinoinensis]|uniref:uncharacterized protein LOC122274364 n=1 Tax=Carya illinoinensis TaxID=32201 RepID=UPI001C72066C|nr:uncharacterized protein LOC122274364 [Carya illinoinensis]
MQVPNTTKTFLWRACFEALPTMLNLFKKKIVVSPMCPICCREEETTTHALWSCSSAMDVWSQGHIFFQKSTLREASFIELYERFTLLCDRELLDLFSVIARSIWLRRNKLLFEGSFLHPNILLRQASQSLEEFKIAQASKKVKTQVASIHPSRWTPPPSNWVKINWDAAVNVDQGRIGIGLVARDHEGSILATKKLSVPSLAEPVLAEALGAFHAASMARELGLNSVMLEGDALQIVAGINHHFERWDRVGMVLLDTRMVLSSLVQWKVVFVRRSGNQFAHGLAKESLELDESSVELVVRCLCNHVPSFP